MKRQRPRQAETVDLDWWRRGRAERRKLLVLGACLASILLGWLLVDSPRALSSGPLSEAHRDLPGECSSCHTETWEGASLTVGRSVPRGAACLRCHGLRISHDPVTLAPSHAASSGAASGELECVRCHREHRGREPLSPRDDQLCVSCHGPGGTAAERGGIEAVVAWSNDQGLAHPAFRGRVDPGGVHFDHRGHLERRMPGRADLECADCHEPDRGAFRRIRFDSHCGGCHRLSTTAGIAPASAEPPGDETLVPHAEPEIVRALLIGRTGPGRSIGEVEATLYRAAEGTCSRCHEVEASGEGPVRIAPSAIPRRWWSARFDHSTHRSNPVDGTELACVDCHGGAVESRSSADVLLPAVESCFPCHGPAASPKRGAGDSCSLCHTFHRARPDLERDVAAGAG